VFGRIKLWFGKNWDIFGILAIAGLAYYAGRSGFPFRHLKPIPYQPGGKRNFHNRAEFETWYCGRFPPGYWEIAFPTPNNEQPEDDKKPDCDDKAELILETADRDGFFLSYALTIAGIYFGQDVTLTREPHAAIIGRCGNTFVYLDQNTGVFKTVCNID